MNEPRPTSNSARPEETASSVAYCWKTRTGSSELRITTAGASRIRSVLPAMAASTTTGADDAKSGRWCSPIPYTSSPTCSATTASLITWRSRSACDTTSPVTGSG